MTRRFGKWRDRGKDMNPIDDDPDTWNANRIVAEGGLPPQNKENQVSNVENPGNPAVPAEVAPEEVPEDNQTADPNVQSSTAVPPAPTQENTATTEVRTTSQALNPQSSSGATNEQVANEVLAGQWGRGHLRDQRLRDAGYDVRAVNDLVGRLGSGQAANEDVNQDVNESNEGGTENPTS